MRDLCCSWCCPRSCLILIFDGFLTSSMTESGVPQVIASLLVPMAGSYNCNAISSQVLDHCFWRPLENTCTCHSAGASTCVGIVHFTQVGALALYPMLSSTFFEHFQLMPVQVANLLCMVFSYWYYFHLILVCSIFCGFPVSPQT